MPTQHYNRWAILVAAIASNICIGTLYAWSVFANPLGQKFGWAPPALALVFTINHGLSPVASTVGGFIQDKIGARNGMIIGGLMFTLGLYLSGTVAAVSSLYLTYSVLAGTGGAIIYCANLGNTVKFFPDKRGLASGLCAAGYGCGAMIVAPIASALIIKYGVLETFQILGGAFFVIIAICTTIVKKAPVGYQPAGWIPPATSVNKSGDVDVIWHKMIRDIVWWMVLMMMFCGTMSGLMILAHASPIGQLMFQLTPMKAAFFVSVITLANALGRIGFGGVSDKIGRSNTIMVMYVVSALSLFNLSFTTSVAGFVASGVGVGAVFGGFMGTMPTIISERYGLKRFGVNYGITFIGLSMAALTGPLSAAKVRVATGTYDNAFLIALGVNIAGLVFAAAFRVLDKRTSDKFVTAAKPALS